MQWVSNQMLRFFRQNVGGDPYSRYEPRDLTPADRLGWDEALSKQDRTPPRNREDIRRLMRARNPVRWHNLQSDYRWLQKQMKKAGLNPEDARYLL